MPELSIIIPVHNQSGYTRSCLASLALYPPTVPFEVIVVDDGSSDDTAQVIAGFYDRLPVRLVTNPPPHRFARACNRGAAEAHGSLLLLLNNDTELLPGWFVPLYRIINTWHDVGIVVPRLIFPDGTVQHCGKVWVDVSAPDAQPYHLYYRFPANHPAVMKSREFQTVTGACMLVRRDEFLSLGGFDEAYLNGWEDDDLCAAYRDHGKRIYYCAESCIIHHQNKTLNERLQELERRLPDRQRILELQQAFALGAVLSEDRALAAEVQAVYAAIEQQLLELQNRFRHNRDHFFSRWGDRLFCDLFVYTAADGVEPSDALGEQISPAMKAGIQQGVAMPLVSIIILTFNRLDVTQACLDSIQRHTPQAHEIIVVDNGSSDGTVEWLKKRMGGQPTIRLIENSTNRGFSAGCNQGIQAARGEYLLLLNNDTVVTADWLTGLLECLKDQQVGVVGPVTNKISDLQQWPWCDYHDPAGLDRFAAEFRQQHRYWWIPSRRVVGFCMLFRRALVQKIGLLDEQFGSGNFEDDDFCLRASLAGYRNLIAGDVFIHHEGSATFAGNQLDYRQALLKNQALFNRKWSRPVTNRDEAARIIRLRTCEKADELCRKGQQNKAVDLLMQEGIAQLPEEPSFYHALAEIFLETDMCQEALDVLAEAPDQLGRTALLKVSALIRMDRVDEATGGLMQAAAVHGHERACVHGDLLRKKQDHAGATGAYLLALKDNPACAEAYSGLADLAEESGDQEAVFRLREQAVTCAGWKQNLLEKYHGAIATHEQLRGAEQILRELRHFYADVSVLTSLHIDLQLRLQQDQMAMDAIEALLVQSPPSNGLYEAALQVRRRLGALQIAAERLQQGMAVSLCMIVKDEEQNLPACLHSIRPLVDEIIIVDTGSTDRTVAVATIFGADVLETDWIGDYAAIRNMALARAQGNWIVVLDADEVISSYDYPVFRQMLAAAGGKKLAYSITTRNYTNRLDVENWQANTGEYLKEEAGRGWMPSDKVRLFPNLPDIRFENQIHEMVEPTLERLDIPVKECELIVHHYGYLDERRQQRKKMYYYELGRRKYLESGGAPHALVELAIQAGGVGRYDEAVELWLKALEIDPDSYLAWFNLGHAYLQKGLFSRGSEASRRAMALRENYREAVINAAICELALGNVLVAVQLVTESLPLNPDYPTLPLMVAILNAVAGDSKSALHQFTQLRDNHIEFQGFIHEVCTKLIQGGQLLSAQRLIASASEGHFCQPRTVELLRQHTPSVA
ncbi:MAG: glycosyltransferase [Geobacter sp.]|nr:glycosyltransferase [Geobacter sp.]